MRFSVRVPAQNAPFRRVRFSLPAQTWSRLTEKRTLGVRPHGKAHSGRLGSRKSTLWVGSLTEKRILSGGAHGKAHSGWGASRKSALCMRAVAQSAPFRNAKPQNASFRRMRFSLPAQTRSRLTEKRTLGVRPHGKAHSGRLESRKSALWVGRLTEKCTLGAQSHGKAHSESHRLGRVHLSVRPNSKPRPANPRATRPAAWRGGCPTPPGRRDVTEKRILARCGTSPRRTVRSQPTT